jgi:hypothetical protein
VGGWERVRGNGNLWGDTGVSLAPSETIIVLCESSMFRVYFFQHCMHFCFITVCYDYANLGKTVAVDYGISVIVE